MNLNLHLSGIQNSNSNELGIKKKAEKRKGIIPAVGPNSPSSAHFQTVPRAAQTLVLR
jgi:hypothetical protein